MVFSVKLVSLHYGVRWAGGCVFRIVFVFFLFDLFDIGDFAIIVLCLVSIAEMRREVGEFHRQQQELYVNACWLCVCWVRECYNDGIED